MARKKTQPRKPRRSAKAPKPSPGGRLKSALSWLCLRLGLFAGVGLIAYTAWLDIGVRGQFEGRRWQLPARIYARPLDLYPGAKISPNEFVSELKRLSYRPGLGRSACYRVRGEQVEIQTRSFKFWDEDEPAYRLKVNFKGQRLHSMSQAGKKVDLARLEPQLIGRIYPNHSEDRILVRLDQAPPLLVKALLAVEDRQFYSHYGISPSGILRALWTNLRAGETRQGGSTLTQQLAKSYFLTNERSIVRKLNDILIALILEAHYDKDDLLQSYLNEIYLGQQGRRAVHGFGLAARFYYGRRLDELNLSEVAMLVGLVKGPSYYNPRRQPKRALERRNLVLRIMLEQGLIDARSASQAERAALGILKSAPPSDSPYPAFLDLVKRQLQRDYQAQDLQSEGLRIFTSLDPQIQQATQAAVTSRLSRLEKSKGMSKGKLQGAVVVTDTHTGEVLALAGGRKPRDNGFNRALDARRPVGSLIKPVVFLSALEQPERFHLMSQIDDAAIKLKNPGGKAWEPKNYDGKSHGHVPLIDALAHSYNQATVRLGMQVGIDKIIKNLNAAGLQQRIKAYPSLLLGALELSPLQVSGLYQTLAAGGFKQPLRSIRNVTDHLGAPLERYPLKLDPALNRQATFLTLRAMQEVIRTGTGRYAAQRLPSTQGLAGKTGTTDDLRDSWFAGFGANHLVVVWLGRDDNSSAGLTGASGALRVWTDVMAKLRPRALDLTAPPGIQWANISASGMDCKPGASTLPYIVGSVPKLQLCNQRFNLANGATQQVPTDEVNEQDESRLENRQ